MDKFMAWMEKYIVPGATKLGNQKHLLAIRDGFLAMIGLTMVSSLCTFITAFPNDSYQAWLKGTEFGGAVASIAGDITWGSFTFMALLVAFAIGNSLWKSYGKEGNEGGLVAVASFLIVSAKQFSVVKDGVVLATAKGLAPANFGAAALFTALIVSLLAVELLRVLSKCKALEIKLPDMVPPAVSKSFATMFPAMIALTVIAIANYFILKLSDGVVLNQIISETLQAPLTGVSDSIGAAILYPFSIGLFWTLGLHGSSIVNAVATPILTTLATQNMDLAASGATTGFNTITTPFFGAFVWIGGAGATLGLLIAAVIAGKKVKQRFQAISAIGMGPGVFNINEPVIFGVPIVLNPVLMIPFILVPVVLSVISFFAIESGLVSPTIVASIPWTMPVGIGGFMATGHISGALLSVFNLFVSIVLYLPFVKMVVAIEEKQMLKQMEAQQTEEVANDK